jgi:hypothetical protein
MRSGCVLFTLFLAYSLAANGQLPIANHSTDWIKSYSKYVEIAGATRAGSEVRAACHAEDSTPHRYAYHAQQGIECDDCYGNGILHVEGGGDKAKIISFH